MVTPSHTPESKESSEKRKSLHLTLLRWFDNQAAEPKDGRDPSRVDWLRVIPFVLMHLGCLGVFWFGYSPVAVAVAGFLYGLRMFAITAFYHRYFAHRSFKTSRTLQFLFALIGAASVQRGPLWWSAHHRNHHAHSDDPKDTHSPLQQGFLKSHMLWFLTRENFRTRHELAKDWQRYPELLFLDRYDTIIPLLFGGGLYGVGVILAYQMPQLGTNGPQMLTWGFFVSTVLLYHATFTVNSLAHVWGSRRYATPDGSRNNAFLALITLGEGWHNNHHHYPGSVRQGFFWWEFDPTFWILRLMACFHLVWDLRPVPDKWRDRGRIWVEKADPRAPLDALNRLHKSGDLDVS